MGRGCGRGEWEEKGEEDRGGGERGEGRRENGTYSSQTGTTGLKRDFAESSEEDVEEEVVEVGMYSYVMAM